MGKDPGILMSGNVFQCCFWSWGSNLMLLLELYEFLCNLQEVMSSDRKRGSSVAEFVVDPPSKHWDQSFLSSDDVASILLFRTYSFLQREGLEGSSDTRDELWHLIPEGVIQIWVVSFYKEIYCIFCSSRVKDIVYIKGRMLAQLLILCMVP